MKNKKSVIIICCFVLAISIIVLISILNKDYDITKNYRIIRNDNQTYSYEITDKHGNVLFSDENSSREPKIEQVDANVLGVSIQAGTGLSTKWTVFCDVENSRVSETFLYVLAAQGDYIAYVEHENGKFSIVVQDIFDQSKYYKTYVPENCSPVATDIVVNSMLNGKGDLVITYLTGEDYTKTDLTIAFP